MIEREYAVRILGEVDRTMLQRLCKGVQLEDGKAHFERIIDVGGSGANHWYHVILHEGRKHEVRRLWESQGVTVSRLIRIRFGTIWLPKSLPTGNHVELNKRDQKALFQLVDLKVPRPSPEASRSKGRHVNSKR
jgi:23S rRNA pseudouridine2605 synthase